MPDPTAPLPSRPPFRGHSRRGPDVYPLVMPALVPPEIAETFAMPTVAQRMQALQHEAQPFYRLAAALSVHHDALDAEEIMQAWDAAVAFSDRDALALQVVELLDIRLDSDPALSEQIARDYPRSLAGPGFPGAPSCLYIDGQVYPSFTERVADLEREGAVAYAQVEEPSWWRDITPRKFIAAWDAASVVVDQGPDVARALRVLRTGISKRPELLSAVRQSNPETLAVQEFTPKFSLSPSPSAPAPGPAAREVATALHADFPRRAAQRPQPAGPRPSRSPAARLLPHPLACTRAMGRGTGRDQGFER